MTILCPSEFDSNYRRGGCLSHVGRAGAAIFYSLIESAKLSGIEPAAYIREATRRAIKARGTVTLPSNLRDC